MPKRRKISWVLDSSVVLMFLYEEAGVETAAKYLDHAAISAVNIAEVIGKLTEKGLPAQGARAAIRDLRLAVIPLTSTLAIRVGEMRPITRKIGLSLGDRACLTTAERAGVPAVTADRAWRLVKLPVKVRVIR